MKEGETGVRREEARFDLRQTRTPYRYPPAANCAGRTGQEL